MIMNKMNAPKIIHRHWTSFFEKGAGGVRDDVEVDRGGAGLVPCWIVLRIAWFFDCGAGTGIDCGTEGGFDRGAGRGGV